MMPQRPGQSVLKLVSTRTYISHGQVQHIVESVGFKICHKQLKEVLMGLLIKTQVIIQGYGLSPP